MNDLKTVRDALVAADAVIPYTGQINAMVRGKIDNALATLDRMIETPDPTEKVEDDKITVHAFGQQIVMSRQELCAYLKLQSGETEKVDYNKLKQWIFKWAVDVNGVPLESDIVEIINMIRQPIRLCKERLR